MDPHTPQRRLFPEIDWSSTATHHSPLEDLQGIGVAILLVALSVALYEALGLVTSGIAGLALIGHYLTGWPTGLLFFVLNLPFYGLSIIRMGWAFTAKTLGAVLVLSLLLEIHDALFTFGAVNPLYGALLAGILLGFGLLAMFRHRATLGGVGILALYLQDRVGWRAGYVQLAIDLAILGLGAFVIPWPALALSLLSAVVLNLFLAINHRPERYVAR